MMKLKRILETILEKLVSYDEIVEYYTEDTKTTRERRKRYRMVNEGGEVGFELDAAEFKDVSGDEIARELERFLRRQNEN